MSRYEQIKIVVEMTAFSWRYVRNMPPAEVSALATLYRSWGAGK